MKHLITRLKPLWSLLVKIECPLCQRATTQSFCPDCLKQLMKCQRIDATQSWCGEQPFFAWGNYDGALKRAIAALKYQNQPQLAQVLGHYMGQAWLKAFPARERSLIVVPIPIHANKMSQRGFNQAELLATAFCHVTGLPLRRHGLCRVRDTEAQFGLSVVQRQQNLSNAFQIGSDFQSLRASTRVLLLDDIYTTGSTIRAVSQVLRRHRISVKGTVVLATPSLHSSNSDKTNLSSS